MDEALGMQIDSKPMAFIPASQRVTTTAATTTLPGMEDMGPIVVVGKKSGSGAANKKKRKREKEQASASVSARESPSVEADGLASSSPERKASSTSKSSKPTAAAAEDEEQEEPYDFTATPNVLDSGPAKKKVKSSARGSKKSEKDDSNKKGKKGKGASGTGYFYNAEFGAPPKQKSDYKGGNKSSTFK